MPAGERIASPFGSGIECVNQRGRALTIVDHGHIEPTDGDALDRDRERRATGEGTVGDPGPEQAYVYIVQRQHRSILSVAHLQLGAGDAPKVEVAEPEQDEPTLELRLQDRVHLACHKTAHGRYVDRDEQDEDEQGQTEREIRQAAAEPTCDPPPAARAMGPGGVGSRAMGFQNGSPMPSEMAKGSPKISSGVDSSADTGACRPGTR